VRCTLRAPTPDPQASRRSPPNRIAAGFRGRLFSEVSDMTTWLWIIALIVSHGAVGVLGMMYGKAHPTIAAKVAEDIAAASKKIGI